MSIPRLGFFLVALVVVMVCLFSILKSTPELNCRLQQLEESSSTYNPHITTHQEVRSSTSSNENYEDVIAFHVTRDRAAGSFPKKRLEFVHIPKTGGTAIESAAADVNVTWSLCHFLGSERSYFISNHHTRCPDAPSTRLKHPKAVFKVSHWHLPPRYFLFKELGYQYNPYENATLFTVVRNPYERLISQYFFSEAELAKRNPQLINDPKRLNIWIQGHLTKLKHARQGEIGKFPEKTARRGEAAYYSRDGHLIPQYDFVYDGEIRTIDHVLHFETLHDEFPKLMKEYGLEYIVLPPKQEGKGRISKKKIGVANLTLDNIRLIERVYGRDFAAFGYEALTNRIENHHS